jgi:hypothetical protein
VEARGRDRGGWNLGEDNATRGSAAGPPGKTGVGGTDPAGASILGAATSGREVGLLDDGANERETARRASRAETPGSLPMGETL